MRNAAAAPQASRAASGAQAGFTILEMVVAVAIFTIVVGAIYALLEVGRSDAFRTGQRAEMLQNARVALNTMEEDARHAGVGYPTYGGMVPDGTLERLLYLSAETGGGPDFLTPVVPGDGVRQISVDGVDVYTDAVTFVYQDNTFNDGKALGVKNIDSKTNTVTVDPDNTKCSSGNLYVYVISTGNKGPGGSDTALGSLMSLSGTDKLLFSTGDPLKINDPGSAGTFAQIGTSGAIKRITWVTYFVKPDRTLVRREYGNTTQLVGAGVPGGGLGGVVPVANGSGVGFVEMPLAYNVDDFQVKYILTDGSVVDDVKASVDADGNPITASQNRQNIRVVQVTLAVRSPQNDPKTKQPIRTTVQEAFYTPNLTVPELPSEDGT